jgi:hypothetical protein
LVICELDASSWFLVFRYWLFVNLKPETRQQ